ncbi:MAG: thioesterase [Porphyromonas sp.]|nr:thioesterase [Porphyromonas sp.]
MSSQTYTLQSTIRPFDLDFRQRYPLSRLVSLMVEAAGEHALELGIGEEVLLEEGRTWVLRRLTIDFEDATPVLGRPLIIDTGVRSWSGMRSDRVFVLRQSDDRAFASASSEWVMLDFATRRPVRLSDRAPVDLLPYTNAGGMEFPMVPRQVIPSDVAPSLVGAHTVRYSDMDLNRHFNTSAWIATTMNHLPINHLDREMKSVSISFIREALYGDTLDVHRASREDMDFVRITGSGGATHYEQSVVWQ